jgi:hypothetical protein
VPGLENPIGVGLAGVRFLLIIARIESSNSEGKCQTSF